MSGWTYIVPKAMPLEPKTCLFCCEPRLACIAFPVQVVAAAKQTLAVLQSPVDPDEAFTAALLHRATPASAFDYHWRVSVGHPALPLSNSSAGARRCNDRAASRCEGDIRPFVCASPNANISPYPFWCLKLSRPSAMCYTYYSILFHDSGTMLFFPPLTILQPSLPR